MEGSERVADLAKGKNHKRATRKTPALPSMDQCRAMLTATTIAPSAQVIEKRGVYVRALRERWPDMTASAALFVMQEFQK
jgi:hypothetical protein